MTELLTLDNIISLFTLTVLEVVLGIDNVVFVSIIMERLPKKDQRRARRLWMVIGIVVRVGLLLLLGWLLSQKGKPVFTLFDKGFDLASLIMIGGGLFLLVKTVMEIHHKLEGDEEGRVAEAKGKIVSFAAAMWQISLIDAVFSFDSVITASGIGKHIEIMILAVVIAMIVMFSFSARISSFIHQRPTLKMLALSFLVMIGMVLIVEGWDSERAHEMHLKNYVYFAMAFSFSVELLNMRLRKKMDKQPIKLREPDPEKLPQE